MFPDSCVVLLLWFPAPCWVLGLDFKLACCSTLKRRAAGECGKKQKNKKQRAEECRFICQCGDSFSSDLIHLIRDVRRWAGPLSTPGCDWCSAVSADGWMAAAGPSRHSPVSLPARKIFKIPKLRASSPTLRGYCALFFKVLSLHVLRCTREKH